MIKSSVTALAAVVVFAGSASAQVGGTHTLSLSGPTTVTAGETIALDVTLSVSGSSIPINLFNNLRAGFNTTGVDVGLAYDGSSRSSSINIGFQELQTAGSSNAAADVNTDGEIGFGDIEAFVDELASDAGVFDIDFNNDSAANLLDVAPFEAALNSVSGNATSDFRFVAGSVVGDALMSGQSAVLGQILVTAGGTAGFVDLDWDVIEYNGFSPSLVTQGTTIEVVAIPAPGAAGLLGVAGLMAARRRR